MDDLMEGLDAEQRAVVAHRDGPSIVIAGPGSGKTRTITTRAAALLREGIAPEAIMMITFTRAAAKQMVQRTAALDSRANYMTAGTFHAVGSRIVQANHRLLGSDKEFTVLDGDDVEQLLKRQIDGVRNGAKNWPRASTVAKIISYATNTGLPIDEVVRLRAPDYEHLTGEIETIAERYALHKLDHGLLAYDDILVMWAALLEDDEIGAELRSRWKQIMLDEQQDANWLQQQVVRGLAGPGGNVMAVGDPCQPPDTLVHKVVEKSHGGPPKAQKARALETVRIADLQVGDTIVGYSVSSSAFFFNRKVLGKTEKPFNGELVVATVGGKISRYTPNHHCVANFSPLRGKIAVYLMKSGNRFRIGRAKMAYDSVRDGFGGNKNGSGPIRRAKAEGADALWLLSLHDTDQDAAVSEYVAQCRFGLSGLTFKSGYVTGGRLLDEQHMNLCWEGLSNIDMHTRARECLTHYGRMIEHPIWSKDHVGNASFKRPAIYRACNLMNGCHMLPFDENDPNHVRRDRWMAANFEREAYVGPVYSLSVSHDEIYVADGIATHNCQAIYGFRGSSPAVMKEMHDLYPEAAVYNISSNYRSTAKIVALGAAMDRMLDTGFTRTLRSATGRDGAMPTILDVHDAVAEAQAVADAILEDKAAGGELADHAVLVRSMTGARRIEAEFLSRQIPFTVQGGTRIDEAAHIRDLLSVARLAGNLSHEPAWMRLLTRFPKIGDKAASEIAPAVMSASDVHEAAAILEKEGAARRTGLATLGAAILAAAADGPPADRLERVVAEMDDVWRQVWPDDWKSRSRDLEAVVMIAQEHVAMPDFLTAITLDGSLDREGIVPTDKPDEKPVTISTVHGSKGLEYKHVHIPAFVQGGMPSMFANSPEEREEEKRIAFVAMTRAKETITFYRPRFNNQNNFTMMSDYESIVAPHVSQRQVPRRTVAGDARVESTKRIDMRAKLLGAKKR